MVYQAAISSVGKHSYEGLGKLEKYFAFIARTAPKLARILFFNMAKYQKKLEHKQMLLGRLME